MITFKQFLVEGGKATEKHGTVRATAADIKTVLKIVSSQTGVPSDTLAANLLGSTRLTFLGHRDDSGDIDIALDAAKVDQDEVVAKMTALTGTEPYVIGGNVFSFAVPTAADRKVQVDLMFMPDLEWARFSHYASEHSAHKSGVRNELLHSALKFSMEPDKDVRVKDLDGNDVARASRAYKLDTGVERIFKVAPERKDGRGRVKAAVKATPDEVRQTMKDIGVDAKFDDSPDVIRDPDRFAELLFGKGVKGKDMMSTEQLIRLIKKFKAEHADEIFKDAVHGILARGFEVPEELAGY